MSQVDLSDNKLCGIDCRTGAGTYDATGINAIADALRVSTSLTEVTLLRNNLDKESATMLTKIAAEKKISLCGIGPDQTSASFYSQGLGPIDSI